MFPQIPQDFSALSIEELSAFIEASSAAISAVTADPASHVNEEFSSTELLAACRAQTEALQAARADLDSREVVTPELTAEELDAFQALAADAEAEVEPDVEPEAEVVEEAAVADVEAEVEAEVEPEVEAVTAAAPAPVRRRLPAPAPDRQAPESVERPVVLTAAAGAPSMQVGQPFGSADQIAKAMQERRRQFGVIPPGTSGEQVAIARADWSDLYPEERKLGQDVEENLDKVSAVYSPAAMQAEMDRRSKGALVASGGLCAPVTPYYQLQMLSVAERPVRAALAGFNADRGGIRYARPAALSVIDEAVGTRTADEDELGGTFATKTCQTVECPPFEETDVEIRFHCLTFGNLGARTFPERVTQWNNLTLAAHARLSDSELLTGIDTASTQIEAGNLGLGISASLLGQILAAAAGIRSRHRTAQDSPLRLLLPYWAVPMLMSDIVKNQYQRFDNDEQKIIAMLRRFNIEPSWYMDSAAGRGQVFGSQGDGALLGFPEEIVWYLYPEGSFLFVDGGTLELGLVRDSVLNATNDFQIFGESFENVAFVGIESYAVESNVCDSGTLAAADDVVCPIDYSLST